LFREIKELEENDEEEKKGGKLGFFKRVDEKKVNYHELSLRALLYCFSLNPTLLLSVRNSFTQSLEILIRKVVSVDFNFHRIVSYFHKFG
jgi:hypothetical protein